MIKRESSGYLFFVWLRTIFSNFFLHVARKRSLFIDYDLTRSRISEYGIFNAKPHLQAVMKAYMRVLKNLHDIVFQYLINLPQPHHIFFTFQYALTVNQSG